MAAAATKGKGKRKRPAEEAAGKNETGQKGNRSEDSKATKLERLLNLVRGKATRKTSENRESLIQYY